MLVDHLPNIVREYKEFRQTGYLKYLYRNKLDKAGFAHDAAYSDSKDLAKRTVLDNILKVAYEIVDMMDIKEH